MSTIAPTITLNSSHAMPLTGLGLWKMPKSTCADQVYAAIKNGYRLLDGACEYGNEVEAGQGVARAISEGLITRSDLFIVSKLGNAFHDGERVEPIVRHQLRDWGIDYFDLYYIHFPIALEYVDPQVRYPPGWGPEGNGPIALGKASTQETWTAMEGLVEKGLSKSIGISNFQGSLILDLLRYAKIVPAVLQIEHHPYLVQESLLQLCKSAGIAVTAYSSFGPQSFLELEWKKALDAPLLFDNPVIKELAEKHGKSPAQVLLRWATQRGIAVIPKSNNEGRLRANLEGSYAWDMSGEELERISALDKGLRFNDPPDTIATGNLRIFA